MRFHATTFQTADGLGGSIGRRWQLDTENREELLAWIAQRLLAGDVIVEVGTTATSSAAVQNMLVGMRLGAAKLRGRD